LVQQTELFEIACGAEIPMSEQNNNNTTYIVLTSLVATLGGFLFGFDSGVINGTVDGLKQAFNSEDVGTGFNVASMLLGCAIGAFFAGQLADKIGRRKVLLIAAILFLISAWGSGIASTSVEFIIYRILGGLAVGAASVISPAYISEITPAYMRGRMTTIQQIAIILGLFIAFISNYLLATTAGNSTDIFWWGYEAWRWMFWMELIPASLFFVLLLFIPESPRFLVVTQQEVHARIVLGKLYGEVHAETKLVEINQSVAEDRHQPRLSDLIDKVSRKVKPIVWVGIGLATFQQLVGINVVFYYGAVLWQAVGFSESDALLINIISGGLSIGACILTILTVDKIGRKPLLMIGSVGMAVTLAVVAWAFSTGTIGDNGNLALTEQNGLIALIAANAYVFFFNGSWGPVMWVMLGEMFPNQIRGSGLAIAGLFQWGSNFLVTMTFPIMLASIGLAISYSIYAAFAVLSVLFVLYMVRETRGVELESMDKINY
jgi:sugar porter (SP) family MFS transporter